MRKRIVIMCVSAAVLSGCGGGETGQLEGGASGVAYYTPSQSGLTDENGTFRYRAGETVRFSVGRIALGSAPGAAKISLFDLAGLAPPTTEAALRRELELLQTAPTPFRRAVNLARFLVALDADGNPANGIDARGRRLGFTTGALDFDLSLQDFARTLDRRVPNLTRNIPLWVPVAQLYRLSRITVPAHARTRVDASYSFAPPNSQSRTYDAAGNIDFASEDADGDGNTDSRYRYTYDSLGRVLTFRSERDDPYPGEAAAVSAQYSFDALGVELTVVQEIDNDAAGVADARYVLENAHDRFGNITTATFRTDSNADGVVDLLETSVFTYDARNLPELLVSSADDLTDGVIDSKATSRATYDAQERMRTVRYEFDDHADGVVDSGYAERFDYSRSGGTERNLDEVDSDLDGDIDRRTIVTTQYDAVGNAIQIDYEADDEADGVIDFRDRTENVYRPDRQLQSRVRLLDFDGDGIFNPGTREQHEYDAAGTRRLVILRDISPGGSAGPGTSIGVWTVRSEYGAGGELLSSTTGYDFNVDNIPDSAESTVTTTQLPVDDGVLLLAREYLAFGGVLSAQLAN